MTTRIAIGIGASSKAVAEDLLNLIHGCISTIESGTILATLDRRSEIASSVAMNLGVDLVLFPAEALASVGGVKTRSAASVLNTGSESIAEAAALAALGPDAKLILERQVGNQCTCAMAVLL
jgi:cobalt-precorrin 5A hydrolase